MRLTELTHIGQIKDLYTQLRTDGYSREDATMKVIHICADLPPEQALTGWIGLADGQYAKRELTLPVALQGLMALHRLTKTLNDSITPGDIERRRKHYIEAPMPERKLGRPKKATP